MPHLTLSIDLYDGRPGLADPIDAVAVAYDRWSFHHILPARYYFVMGALLAHMFRAALAERPAFASTVSGGGGRLSGQLGKALQGEVAAMGGGGANAHYGPEAAAFVARAEALNLMTFWKQIAALDPNGRMEDKLCTDGRFVPERIGLATLCPPWGGFAGMLNVQRRNDPGEKPEEQKPYTLHLDHWSRVMAVREAIHAFCPEIASVQVRRFEGRLDWVNGWRVLYTAVQVLNGSFMRTHPFTPAEWDYHTDHPRPWAYVPPERLQAEGLIRGERIRNNRFVLNKDGRGLMGAAHARGAAPIRVTRGPGDTGKEMFEAIPGPGAARR